MKKIYLILILLFLGNYAGAQKKFMFDADYGLFKYNENKSVLEIYFAFYQNSFEYTYSDMSYNANAYLQVQLTNKDKGVVALNKDFVMNLRNTDTSAGKLKNKELSQITLFLDNGYNYHLMLIGSDNKSVKKSDTLQFDFMTRDFNSGEVVQVSDIQFSSGIQKSTNKESSLYKFGYEVTPNPNALFGNNIPEIYYYFEIYNLKKSNISSYSIKGDIINNQDDTVKSFINDYTEIKDLVNVTGNINIDSLPSGSYVFNFSIISNGTELNHSSKKFYIFNTTKTNYSTTDDKDYLQSEIAALKENDLDEEFSKIIYIRNDNEKNEYEKLKTENEKRRFLFNFWKRHDTNPVTPKLEFREEYLKRYAKANSLFKQSFTEGWKTDRGRIYMLYGAPDDIERHEMESDIANYQIWYYNNLEGGRIAVFAESIQSGQGYLYLVHSTIRNEFQDENWKLKLRKIR